MPISRGSSQPRAWTQGFPGGSDGEDSDCNVGDLGLIPGWERALEKGMATHPSILAWRIPVIEEPGGPQSMGSQRVGHDWVTFTSLLHCRKNFFFPLNYPRGTSGKEFLRQCRRRQRCQFDPWIRKILWSRKSQLTPVFLPEKFHGQRSLMGCSPGGHRELNAIEHT